MRHLHKLTHEMQDTWFKVLSVALMRALTALEKEGLHPFECVYGRPFLCTDLIIDPQFSSVQSLCHVRLFVTP